MHYKSNEMALWLKLVPQLIRAGSRFRSNHHQYLPGGSNEVSTTTDQSNKIAADDDYVPVRPRFPPPAPPRVSVVHIQYIRILHVQ